MKTLTTIIIVIITLITLTINADAKSASWTDNWTINGMPLRKFSDAGPKDYAWMAAGMAASFTAHWLGHVTYLQMNGIKWHQDGQSEIADQYLDDREANNFGQAGFLGQCVVGTIIKFTPINNTYFGTGYHIGTFAEISTYKLMHGADYGDLNLMDRGNNDYTPAWVGYTAWSTVLLLDWQKVYMPKEKYEYRYKPATTE